MSMALSSIRLSDSCISQHLSRAPSWKDAATGSSYTDNNHRRRKSQFPPFKMKILIKMNSIHPETAGAVAALTSPASAFETLRPVVPPQYRRRIIICIETYTPQPADANLTVTQNGQGVWPTWNVL